MTVTPLCPVFGTCGGCQYQDIPYHQELLIKEREIRKLFQPLDLPEACFHPILPSPQAYHYRHRVDLKLQKNKAKQITIGFSPLGRKEVVPVSTCPIARQEIADFLPSLLQQAALKLPSKYKVASLVVRCGQEGKVHWGGIGHRSLIHDAADYFWVDLSGRRIHYEMSTFFQANLFILPSLIDLLRSLPLWSGQEVLYDLYGGVGLFGVCLSDLVRRVVLIEENLMSIRMASHNVVYNNLTNFNLIRGRVEDVLPNVLGESMSAPKVIMVDPPRAGLSQSMINLLNGLEGVAHVVYLSCDPRSLVTNLANLSKAWHEDTVVPLDFFPRTRHIETLVVLKSHTFA